jgi:hypothetical protein
VNWTRVLLGDPLQVGWAPAKAAVLFLLVVVILRLGERRTLAEFAVFDFVVAVAVGAIIGRTATAPDASVLTAAAALVALLAAQALITRLRFLPAVRRIVDKPARVLIRDGQVQRREVRRCGLTDDDLASLLRRQGHLSPDSVRLAVFEPRGALSDPVGSGRSGRGPTTVSCRSWASRRRRSPAVVRPRTPDPTSAPSPVGSDRHSGCRRGRVRPATATKSATSGCWAVRIQARVIGTSGASSIRT